MSALPPSFDLVAHLYRQRAFSRATFGPGRYVAVVAIRIRRSLVKLAKATDELEFQNSQDIRAKELGVRSFGPSASAKTAREVLAGEVADLILLSFDLAWRAGLDPESVCQAIHKKQSENESRVWPDWRLHNLDKAIDRDGEAETEGEASSPLPESLDFLLDEIGAERMRQVACEGFDAEHDADHDREDLGLAAAAYTLSSVGYKADAEAFWPWQANRFKPKSSRRDLIRAAALILAEIDRLDGVTRDAREAVA